MSNELENKNEDQIGTQENPFALEEDSNVESKKENKKSNDHGLDFNLPTPKGSKEDIETLDVIRESYKKSGAIAIRPYINPKRDTMGLEKNKMVLFPGTHQLADMAAIEFRGKTKYLNGLDEFSPSIQSMPEGDERSAKVRQIRTIVAQLEREKAYNHVDIDDVDFWSKITMFRPDNKEVWGKMSRKLDNNVLFLDPVNKIEDLLTVIAIENGGFPEIAKSHEDARTALRDKKWFLDKQSDTVSVRTSSSKLRNKALGLLEELSDENPRKLFYVCKLVDTASLLYNYSTLPTVIYDNMDGFIRGEGGERDGKRAANLFMDYANREVGELKIRAAIKDSSYLRYLITKGDQMIYTAQDNVLVGRNLSEVYEYLVNPLNEKVLHGLMDKAMSHWKK